MAVAGVSYLTLMPTPPPPPSHWLGFDKVAHFGCWAMIAALLVPWLAHRRSGRPVSRPVPKTSLRVAAAGMAIVHGGLIELIQIPVPGRSGDLLDWLADGVGAFVGAAVASRLWAAAETGPGADGPVREQD